MRPSSAAVALSWTLLVVPGPSLAQSVELRPIDRATVRVIGVGGVQPILFQSAETGVARIPGIPNARHGSGVVVRGDGLVLTAAHVTSGADEVAVLLPGQSAALPARVVYVASDYDVAFLQIPGPVESFVTLPDRDPVLRVSDPVTASGYPLDVRERSPAAVSGTISRENNDGSLQLAMGVNPGNSGGPVVDADGRIVGILSRRGEPGAGVESIALAVPVRHLRAALVRADAAVAGASRPPFGDRDRTMALLLADFVRTSNERPIWAQTTLPLLHRAANGVERPEHRAIVATHAWNMAMALLENRRARDPGGLGAVDRAKAQWLLDVAVRVARDADARAPYLRRRYPILRSILASGGRPFVPPRRSE